MITFLLSAALFMGAMNAVAEEPHVYAPEPPYPVELILEQQITMDISGNDYRGYLYLEYGRDEALVPDALIGDLECYSDGTGGITLLDDFKEIWHIFTPSGQLILNNDMVTVGSKICDKKLEELYGYHIGESLQTWHF